MVKYLVLLIGLALQGFQVAHSESQVLSETKEPIERPFYSYHQDVGIPRAARIFEAEQVMENNEGDINSRIVGGVHSALGERPFLGGIDTKLTDGTRSVCGCTLIRRRWSMTAAHCWWDGKHQAEEFHIRFGSLRLYQGGVEIITKNVTMHENYSSAVFLNDIAIAYHDAVPLSDNIKTIRLPRRSMLNDDFVGEWVTAAAFGKTSSNADVTSNQVQSKVDLQVINNTECKQLFAFYVKDTNICTKGVFGAGIGTCQGDSGSCATVVVNGTKYPIGIVSFGREECDLWAPYISVFTRVTKFVPWLKDKMKKKNNNTILILPTRD